MRKYPMGGQTAQARAVSVLMFIVESGVGYCLLWVCTSLSLCVHYQLVVLTMEYVPGTQCLIFCSHSETLEQRNRY